MALQSGGSNTLVTQFELGAKADLLLLADADLVQRVLAVTPSLQVAVIATNKLVLIRPTQSPSINSEVLGDPNSTLALADSRTAPLGRYSQQVLNSHFSGVHPSIKSQRVYLKDATAVLAAVSTGHADMGIVYLTDAEESENVTAVEQIPESTHTPILYQAILTNPDNPRAAAFFDRLTSSAGRKLLEQAGFHFPETRED